MMRANQTIAWASNVVKVVVGAPLIDATATPVWPGNGEIDKTAACGESMTLRYCASVDVFPFQFVAAKAVRRSRVSFIVRILLVKTS